MADRRINLVRTPADALLLIGGTAMLVLSALPVDEHRISGLERAVFRVVNDLPSALYEPVWVLMQLGNLVVVPVAALVALLVRRWRLAGGLLLGGLGTYLLAKVVKRIVTRGRPATVLTAVHIHGPASLGLGYVSGHAAVVAVLATVAWPWLSRRARLAAAVLGAAVGIGRMYVGAHLPLDIVGGAGLGVAVGGAVRLLLSHPGAKRRSEAPASERPASTG